MPKKRIQIGNIISLEDLEKIQPQRRIRAGIGLVFPGGRQRPMTATENIYRDPFSPEAIRMRDEAIRQREAILQREQQEREQLEGAVLTTQMINEAVNRLVV